MVFLIIMAVLAVTAILSVVFYRFWFLRNPEITVPRGNNIVSPAGGKVSRIVKTSSKSVTISKHHIGKVKALAKDVAKDCIIISIMLTPLDVHYQKAPMDGKIIYSKHKAGKLYNAVLGHDSMRATLENESNQILISTAIGNIKVVQIAGFVARRICSFAEHNDNIKKGQDIGVIKLGSQVSIIIPDKKNIMIKVKEGERVMCGETVIAEY